ncbi:unnamed protein product [Linum tenue]|uniref:Uncharacterized protein n=1 Tax=Linum tenue TaxID=586396 RepID=A0AAV0K692_9ROSI|nr:unnamed protein product [Linum tenue]
MFKEYLVSIQHAFHLFCLPYHCIDKQLYTQEQETGKLMALNLRRQLPQTMKWRFLRGIPRKMGGKRN